MHKCCAKSYVDSEERELLSSELATLIIEEDGRDSIYLTSQLTSSPDE